MRWRKKIYETWLKLTLKKKITLFSSSVLLIIVISFLFDFWLIGFMMLDIRYAMDSNSRTNEYMNAIETETDSFKEYIMNPDIMTKQELQRIFTQTENATNSLPFDIKKMSYEHYARTCSIKNCYVVYVKKRNYFLSLSSKDSKYIDELYQIYDMQAYLKSYARDIMRFSVENEYLISTEKIPIIKNIPFVLIVCSILFITALISFSKAMYKILISPVTTLANASKRIAQNDFFIEDVYVENKDEMGALVKAFNKMKCAAGKYILMLEEKRQTLDKLHKEELERLKMEKSLDKMKMELLMSQMNPHFLFNTLNVISGMAKLEGALTTQQMIKSLSSLFRYNIKTTQSEVTLAQELRVLKDYMYLQQMRFGERIQYNIFCEVDAEKVLVPVFSLQPLAENAIIHGISDKEEGGKIHFHIWQNNKVVNIDIKDTGLGISEKELQQIRQNFNMGNTDKIGLGLGNISQRIRKMYNDGAVEINSTLGEGTTVTLKIPQTM